MELLTSVLHIHCVQWAHQWARTLGVRNDRSEQGHWVSEITQKSNLYFYHRFPLFPCSRLTASKKTRARAQAGGVTETIAARSIMNQGVGLLLASQAPAARPFQGRSAFAQKILLYGKRLYVKSCHIDVIVGELSVAERYDVLFEGSDSDHDVWGVHRSWKQQFCKILWLCLKHGGIQASKADAVRNGFGPGPLRKCPWAVQFCSAVSYIAVNVKLHVVIHFH